MPNNYSILLVFLLTTAVAGSAGLVWDIDGWYYLSLEQPSFAPPNWLFGPVWTTLYALMAVSAWRLAKIGRGAALALAFWTLQITLNAMWTPVFFGGYDLAKAFYYIVALWIAIAATIVTSWRQDKWASVMLWPYLGWVSFASVLNYTFWTLNP